VANCFGDQRGRAASIIAQIFCGVAGMSMWRMP
jgi:hypothetical protein